MNEFITAYVLGEMAHPERVDFEAKLQQDSDLQQQVEDMRSFCQILDIHVAQTSKVESANFSAEQKQKVISAFSKIPPVDENTISGSTKNIIRAPLWRHPFILSSSAIAACLTVLFMRYASFEEPISLMSESKYANETDNTPILQESAAPADTGKPTSTTITPGLRTQNARTTPQTVTFADAVDSQTAMNLSVPESTETRRIPPTSPSSLVQPYRIKEETNTPHPAQKESNQFGRSLSETNSGLLPFQSESKRNVSDPISPSSIPDDYSKSVANRERYQTISENPFIEVTQQPLSTFSVHADGASYANMRRFLNDGQRPPLDAIRIEELINYFPYDYEPPAQDQAPFSVKVDITEAPWQPLHRLARIAIKGAEVHQDRKPANVVFLVDVSGSMNGYHKLVLVKQSLDLFVEKLNEQDRLAIVTYAGDSKVVLESTPATNKTKISMAIQSLVAGGSTNGSGGIKTAYEEARRHLIKDGINRVILCSDGDFNVGISNPRDLEKLIAEEAKSNIFLTVLGFGSGNLNEHVMETLATKGNGHHAYIDSLGEARKVLSDQIDATLMTIAKDVKIQIEFNPAQVASYRLIGYENRTLNKEDFNNDKKDAGEIGAGHTVTALYEIVPTNLRYPNGKPLVDELKYSSTISSPSKDDSSTPAAASAPAVSSIKPQPAASNPETMTVKLRYKRPADEASLLIEVPVTDHQQKLQEASADFKFATAVAGFGLLLRQSPHAGDLTWDQVRQLAIEGKGTDRLGYRGEFLQLIDKARSLIK